MAGHGQIWLPLQIMFCRGGALSNKQMNWKIVSLFNIVNDKTSNIAPGMKGTKSKVSHAAG